MAVTSPVYSPAVASLWDAAPMSVWVYFLGERTGRDIKIGSTSDRDLRKRVRGVNGAQTTDESYVLLAAVRGDRGNEKITQRHFTQARRTDKGARTEYFWPEPELIEYINWLRSQHFAAVDDTHPSDELPLLEPAAWLPDGTVRRVGRPALDPEKLVQDYDATAGPLMGTSTSSA